LVKHGAPQHGCLGKKETVFEHMHQDGARCARYHCVNIATTSGYALFGMAGYAGCAR
jgi:hypothetical protein